MKYIWIASTDVLYQGSTLFSLMLLGIILANLYFEDFKTGCYKYIIMTGVNKINFFIGKLLFTTFVVLGFIVISFICVTTIGILFWGTYDLSMRKITEAFALYVITIIPITSFIFFLYDIVLIIKNVRIVNFLAVIIPLIIGILDSITGTKKLSPIGLLSIFNEEPPIAGIPNLSGYLIVELIWLFVFVFINYIIQKKYQDTI